MTESQRPIRRRYNDDDFQGHGGRYNGADAEGPEGDDTEGHGLRSFGDAESAEGEDTEGHVYIEDRQDGQGLR